MPEIHGDAQWIRLPEAGGIFPAVKQVVEESRHGEIVYAMGQELLRSGGGKIRGMSHKYIAVDLGAESGRVMLGEVSLAGIALTEVHRFANLQIAVTHGEGGRGQTLHWDIFAAVA